VAEGFRQVVGIVRIANGRAVGDLAKNLSKRIIAITIRHPVDVAAGSPNGA